MFTELPKSKDIMENPMGFPTSFELPIIKDFLKYKTNWLIKNSDLDLIEEYISDKHQKEEWNLSLSKRILKKN